MILRRVVPVLVASALAACGAVPSSNTIASSAGGSASPPATSASARASLPGSAPGPAPGQWQLVLEVDAGAAGAKVPPQTMTLCSTPEDKRQWQDMVGGKSAAGCTVKDFTAAGATISYAMQCGGGIEGRTTIRIIDDDHYAGESTLTLTGAAQQTAFRSKVTATRLSPQCRK